MNRFGFSRRGFLKGIAGAAGAAVGARIPGSSWIGDAMAATEPTSVLMLHFTGGYNAIFASANTLLGKFGVTAGNHTVLGAGLAVDNTFASSMSPFVKNHMAAIGVRHGISQHPAAQRNLWSMGNQNAGLVLAKAMGGTGSIKAAVVGGNLDSDLPGGNVGGVSFQSITDLEKTIDALGGGIGGPRVPDRGISLAGVTGSEAMSHNQLDGSPASLESLKNGYAAAIDTLKKPMQTFDLPALKTAYGLPANQNTVRSFASRLAAAELMIRSGTNVVALFDGGWDTHNDVDGVRVRNMMTSYVLSPLNTFLTRMVQDPTRNVVVCMIGDFSRSLPGSDHQPNLSATVIGKYVKQGTTGRVDGNVRLTQTSAATQQLWAYVAAAAKTEGTPFGANPHNLLL